MHPRNELERGVVKLNLLLSPPFREYVFYKLIVDVPMPHQLTMSWIQFAFLTHFLSISETHKSCPY